MESWQTWRQGLEGAVRFDGPIVEQIGLDVDGPQFDLLQSKFEPERLRVELFVPVLVHGGDIESGGLVQAGLCCLDPGLLQSLEGRSVLVGLAAQAALLNAEIVELALVSQKGLGLDQYLARAFVVAGEQIGEFHPSEGKDAHFEGGDAGQAPFGIGEGLDQSQFLVANGLVALAESGEMGLIERGIFGGQQDGAAGEPGFEGIGTVDNIIAFKIRAKVA